MHFNDYHRIDSGHRFVRKFGKNLRIKTVLSYPHFMRFLKGESSTWGKVKMTCFKFSGRIIANREEIKVFGDLEFVGKNRDRIYARYSQAL